MGNGRGKPEPTQPGIARVPAFTRSWLIVLLFRPNSPTADTFHDKRFVNLDVSPFENGGLDEGGQPGYIEDVAKRKITAMSIN